MQDRVVTVSGVETSYTVAGEEGPPLVLIHGGAGTRRDWSKNLDALASRHRVYVPDLVGYGDSARPGGTYTVDRFTGFLREFMDRVGIDRACLVGHSLGGRIALEAARRTPEVVSHLVLVSPIGFGRLSPLGFFLGTALWVIWKAARRPLPYPALQIEMRDGSLKDLGDIGVPAMIVWGRWDVFFPAWYSRRAGAAISGSTVRLFNMSGHARTRTSPGPSIRPYSTFCPGRSQPRPSIRSYRLECDCPAA